MKVPTTLLGRPGRAAAVLAATVAVAAGGGLAVIAGTASAQEIVYCSDNVNVRAEPSLDSDIIGVCETGTEVVPGAVENGFVELPQYGGWASTEFVAVSESAAPASPREEVVEESTSNSSTTAPRERAEDDERATPEPSSPLSDSPLSNSPLSDAPLPVGDPTSLLGGLLG